MIIYIVEAFNKENEFLEFEVNIPQDKLPEISKIMGWSSNDLEEFKKGLFGSDLNAEQAKKIEVILQREFYSDTFDFQISCGSI